MKHNTGDHKSLESAANLGLVGNSMWTVYSALWSLYEFRGTQAFNVEYHLKTEVASCRPIFKLVLRYFKQIKGLTNAGKLTNLVECLNLTLAIH